VSARRALAVYRLIFSALIIVASFQTLLAAQGDHAVVLLAVTEIAGALILCWRRTQARRCTSAGCVRLRSGDIGDAR
jgi:hypothetical protein